MGQLDFGKSIRQMLEKYKYAVGILAVGLCLMLLPDEGETAPQVESAITDSTEAESMEMLLEEILNQVDGAGKVSVLLSEREGSQTIYQINSNTDTDAESTSEETDTVIITDADRNEQGLVLRTDPPKYMGAVIVCQGADRADVRLAIVNAVQCITGLGANQISVVKMK